MKTKYSYITIYATQGGGEAVRDGNHDYVFLVPPDWYPNPCPFKEGDRVPEEWGVQRMYERYTLLPKEERKVESRNVREGSHQKRHSYWNRKRIVTRKIKKTAKLSYKGTLRSITKSRIKEVMHRVGVQMAKEERQKARKFNLTLSFNMYDQLRVVNIDDCEEGLRLKDICVVVQQGPSTKFVTVKIRRNGRVKQIEVKRFILHKRFIEKE